MYRKLLLPMLGAGGAQPAAEHAALAAGMGLAAALGAHLEGLVVRADPRMAVPLAADGVSAGLIDEMVAASTRDGLARAERLAAGFAAVRADAGLGEQPQAGAGSAALRVLEGRAEDIVPYQARLADLTILAQPDPRADLAANECLHNVLFESGRPVLVVPAQAGLGAARPFARICIAWNGTTEASAALAASMAFLRAADAVCVLHADAYQRTGPVAAELLPYLALHGINADVMSFEPQARDLGAGMLAAASRFGAELLCMGAYSHSRLRQMILGGVTRHVLEHARMMVLMSR